MFNPNVAALNNQEVVAKITELYKTECDKANDCCRESGVLEQGILRFNLQEILRDDIEEYNAEAGDIDLAEPYHFPCILDTLELMQLSGGLKISDLNYLCAAGRKAVWKILSRECPEREDRGDGETRLGTPYLIDFIPARLAVEESIMYW